MQGLFENDALSWNGVGAMSWDRSTEHTWWWSLRGWSFKGCQDRLKFSYTRATDVFVRCFVFLWIVQERLDLSIWYLSEHLKIYLCCWLLLFYAIRFAQLKASMAHFRHMWLREFNQKPVRFASTTSNRSHSIRELTLLTTTGRAWGRVLCF